MDTDLSKKKASTMLFDAADNLEKGEWFKGDYVMFIRQGDNMRPCFCAHGSIQFCGNPTFRKLVEEKHELAGTLSATGRGAINATALVDIDNATNQYKEYCQKYYTSQYEDNRNLFLAHFYAYKVGCSIAYNDHLQTTKEKVIAKLREAGQLAASEAN